MTVVIATLGGSQLKQTIGSINSGSIVPAEILVCIPDHEASKVSTLSYSNVQVIITECRGQVAQRVAGFRKASHDIVMQLDDDALLSESCIQYLLESLAALGDRVAVAPALLHIVTGESVYRRSHRLSVVEAVYHWLMNGSAGYQPGRIDKAGAPVGIDPMAHDKSTHDVEWAAGGCLMHRKANLVVTDFYPFKGKAYCEDIIHSCLLRNSGVNLVVDTRARCYLEPRQASVNFSVREFSRDLASDFRARRYFMRISSRGTRRMYLYYLVSCVSYGFKKLLHVLKSVSRKAATGSHASRKS